MKNCECPTSQPIMVAVMSCPVVVVDGKISLIIESLDASSTIRCAFCGGELVSLPLQCPFLATRMVVGEVCGSCIRNDQQIKFTTDLNYCASPPISGGHAYEG